MERDRGERERGERKRDEERERGERVKCNLKLSIALISTNLALTKHKKGNKPFFVCLKQSGSFAPTNKGKIETKFLNFQEKNKQFSRREFSRHYYNSMKNSQAKFVTYALFTQAQNIYNAFYTKWSS